MLTTCSAHGLTYDPALHSGCVLCRRSTAPPKRSRATLYVWLGVFAFVAIGGTGIFLLIKHLQNVRTTRAETFAKKDDAEREQRQAPVTTIAPAPLPSALPLVGAVGADADGYPTQYVDRPAFRSLLWHRKHADLSRYFEKLQSDFEADSRREYWMEDATATFESAEPELKEQLDEWVTATPQSFAPYLARAAHWVAVALARRGGKYAGETSKASFAAMEEAFGYAQEDLTKALAIRPKLVAARGIEIEIHSNVSERARMKAALHAALAVCRSCYIVRTRYIQSLEPRWGGSYAEMAAFATDAARAKNPRMRLLPGFIDRDKARLLWAEKKLGDALAAIDRACALGDGWSFLALRGRIRNARGELPQALADLDRAAAVRPGEPSVLFDRARVYTAMKRAEPAGRDLLAGLRVDPTDSNGRAIFDAIVGSLAYEGWEHYKAGRRDDALRVLDLANDLAPSNRDVLQRRSWIVTGAPYGSDAGPDIAALEAAVKASPDDFRALQSLDYALAPQGKFDRIVAMWTDYLARHPHDGPAYRERGGANFHLKKLDDARADYARACELGVSEGCIRAEQLEATSRGTAK